MDEHEGEVEVVVMETALRTYKKWVDRYICVDGKEWPEMQVAIPVKEAATTQGLTREWGPPKTPTAYAVYTPSQVFGEIVCYDLDHIEKAE